MTDLPLNVMTISFPETLGSFGRREVTRTSAKSPSANKMMAIVVSETKNRSCVVTLMTYLRHEKVTQYKFCRAGQVTSCFVI